MDGSSNDLALPEGFRVRAPDMADLPAAYDLLTACDMANLGTPDTILEDLREEWEDLQLERDTSLVLGPDGTPAGLATITGEVRMRVEVYVHPVYAGRGIESYLRHQTENWAKGRAPSAPDGEEARLETWISSRQLADAQLLESMNYMLAERYRRMRIDLAEPPSQPESPEGIRIRTAIRGEDERAIYEVLTDADSDNPRHEPADYAGWSRLMVDTYRYDPSLWWMALEDEEIVGAALGVQFPDEGWVRLVGVRREWRRRGIATALLRTAFGEFWRRSYSRVELGVDPDSPYGAQRIYERAGMHVAFELAKYQKPLRHP